jgi:flagellar FliL protein
MRLFALFIFLLSCFIPGLALAADEEEGEEAEKTQVAYFSLSPSLITNVQEGARYLRCDVQLMTKDAANLEAIRLHAPAIRHELLLLMGEQKGKALKTASGKEKLRKMALKAAAKVMKKQTGKESVDDLFFTAYFVQ